MAKKTIVKGMKSSVIQAPWSEFRNQHDARGNPGDEGTRSVDECALQPIRTAIFPPVHDHAGLRERKGEKRAHGIERNQSVGNTAEKDEYTATQ
jgi:hypothetical protein